MPSVLLLRVQKANEKKNTSSQTTLADAVMFVIDEGNTGPSKTYTAGEEICKKWKRHWIFSGKMLSVKFRDISSKPKT